MIARRAQGVNGDAKGSCPPGEEEFFAISITLPDRLEMVSRRTGVRFSSGLCAGAGIKRGEGRPVPFPARWYAGAGIDRVTGRASAQERVKSVGDAGEGDAGTTNL